MGLKKLTAWLSAASLAAAMITPVTVSHAEGPVTITVGQDREYTSIREAVAKAKELNPQSEAERVTIDVDPGTYEEQVKFDGMKYVTLEQTPGTEGKVNLSWYYCTGYCASNVGPGGGYDPDIDWTLDKTWTGYKESDEEFTKYTLGQSMEGISTISYYDTNGVAHENVKVESTNLGATRYYDQMAALIVNSSSSDIVIKDLNIVNSVVVMVTQGQKDAHLTPAQDGTLPARDALTICDEDTVPEAPADVLNSSGVVDLNLYKAAVAGGKTFTAEESAFLVRSSGFNERGHAISLLGDRVTLENVRARGNQDSIYIAGGRFYFKNCDLIGGTDYIYGDATAVFDSCKLGAAGMTDKDYGATITATNTNATNPYGYLFFNCEVYNVLDNITDSLFGRPWYADAQVTFFNTLIDDTAETGASKAGIGADGWRNMSDNKREEARFYEYGTNTRSGAAVDYSSRPVNTTAGMGSVLDKWQILEFNPRNYFAARGKWTDDWDPMGFASTYLTQVDKEIAASEITVPAGEETKVSLPTPIASDIEFHWVSASANAVVSEDETTLTVIRPAAGAAPIESSVILYARDKNTGFGDKKIIPVTIHPTTDTTNVFSIPVTIEQSVSADNTYTVTVSKNGALIKTQDITVSGTTAEAVIESIPADIVYDVTIVSESNGFTVTVPADGKTTVTGTTGGKVPLAVTATKLVDETIDVHVSTTAAGGNQTYDLIALAKENGADSSISSSDIISVEMDVAVTEALSKASYIDISSGTPSSSNGAVAQRFTLFKLNESWKQIDTVDNTQGFSGSNNSEHQYLNITGKFDYSTVHHIKATIDYKAGTVTVDGSASGSNKSETPFTFGSFPENASKGTLKMGVFIGSTADSITVSNVQVTYKKIVRDGEEPTPVPTEIPVDPVDVLKYPFDNAHVTNGNQCATDDTLLFVAGVDAEIAALFADAEDRTRLDAELVAHYKNYIGGTNEGGSHPRITVTAPAGNYKLYLLGYNNESAFTAEIAGKVFTAGEGTDFAYKQNHPEYVLKLYTMDITLEHNVKDEILTFDAPIAWLPDTYAVVIKYVSPLQSETDPTPVPTETPDGKGITVIPASKDNFSNIGRQNDNSESFTFTDTAPEMAKYIFKSKEDSTKINSEYMEHYMNYIGGSGDTNNPNPNPIIKVTPETAGKYNIYLVGYNHGDNITASIGDRIYTAGAGVNFASKDSNTSYVLKVYTIAVELPAGESAITFNSSSQWLPDTYAIAVVGTAEKPAFERAEAVREQFRDPAKGTFADTYRVDVDCSRYSLPSLQWVITNTEEQKAKEPITTIVSGDSTVSFGLIISGTANDLDTIKSVSLEAAE